MTAAEQRNMEPTDPPALAQALRFLELGLWPVVITGPDDPHVTAPGKQPIGLDWGKVRPTERSLRAKYAGHRGAGVGLKLGRAAGVVDVEIDDRESGEATLLEMMGGEVLVTMGWESRRGDHHLVRWDDRLAAYGKTILKVGGVEVRAGSADDAGKQIQSVTPPTPNVDGSPRTWNGVETIARLPDCFFAYLDRVFAGSEVPEPVPVTIRYQPRPGQWTPADRARAYLAKIAPAVSGQGGHDRTFDAACNAGPGFGLAPEEFAPLLREWSLACQPPWSEKELQHKVTEAYKVETRRGWKLEEDRGTPLTPKGGAYGVNGVNGVPQVEEVEPPIVVREWPEPPGGEAFHGLAGRIVAEIDPYTEADRVAVLIQFLVAFGNLIGRQACWHAGAETHFLNLFACIVGLSSKGRKGTSWATVRWLLEACDPDWVRDHVLGGLVSGEGMIWAVRDPIEKDEPVKERGRVIDYQKVVVDAGVSDKRALFLESEMGRVLKVMNREGNTLSDLIRQAWETGHLRTVTKNNPAKASGAHISIVGHITTAEAAKYLNETEAGNGFGNRFLWACVKRSKQLPRGAMFRREDFAEILDGLARAVSFVNDLASQSEGGVVVMARDDDAEAYWDTIYGPLSEGKPGLLGSIVARAEAQVMRLACLYALLDRHSLIEPEHIDAALALWRYCEASARYVFGDSLGDRDADHLLSALRSHPGGLTRSQIRSDVFGRNKSADDIARIIGRLLEFNRVRSEEDHDTGGRPRTLWFAVDRATP